MMGEEREPECDECGSTGNVVWMDSVRLGRKRPYCTSCGNPIRGW